MAQWPGLWVCIKGALYGIELSTRNGKIWPTRERQHRQYLKYLVDVDDVAQPSGGQNCDN